MDEIIKDEVIGELKYHKNNFWVRRLDAPFLNSKGELKLVVQDDNKEGILDVQREAYKTYLQNEDKYKSCVTDLMLDYYKWNYEYVARTVKDLEECDHKDVITEKELLIMVNLQFLFICRDGSFGYAFGCCWDLENGLAVLLSESEPRVISKTQLKNLHKVNDPTLGLLVHDGKKAWKGLEINSFFGKPENLEIELEGGVEEGITEAQRKAYAEYLTKKDAFFSATQKRAKEVYKGAKDHDLLPKTLYIDREGNYGWKCYTPWNDGYNAVILSDGEVQMAMADVLYNYAEVIANRTKKEWYTEETAYVSLFGELQPMCVTRANYEFEKDEDQEIREGKFTDREVELLLWLTNELNSTDIADDVLEYCNNYYDGACYYDEEKEDYVDFEPIEKIDLLDELYINKIYLKTQHAAKNKRLPEISLAGECECDPDHGIAICFRGKKLIDIGSEDFGF